MASADTPTRTRPLTIALIGNPNTGKSTLFNALAGMNARIGNFPGCTVEKKIGHAKWDGHAVALVDLPGTYSLSPRSLDELVSVDVLLGRQADVGRPDAVLCIVDAANLERNLYLVSQVLDVGLPVVLCLNMTDVAATRGITIDTAALEKKLGVPVVTTEAHRRRGLEKLQAALVAATTREQAPSIDVFPQEFAAQRELLREELQTWNGEELPRYLLDRLLIDVGGQVEAELATQYPAPFTAFLQERREALATANQKVPAIEARSRYAWVRQTLADVVTQPAERPKSSSDTIDRLLTHRFFGLVFFAAMMFVVFQAIYAWAGPFMEYVEAGQEFVAGLVSSSLAPGALRSLLVDGVIAGVGGVLVFLPQIVLLFLFIAILEDCGYMARAAFLMDKLMTKVGLSGKSFVPLMSSYACAVPGIMATRVIENRSDRMITILIAPLMSCSARLPVYLLLITAFVPAIVWANGWVSLQGLVMFGFYALGAIVAIPVAWLLKKTFFKGETAPFVMELPGYKWPSPRIVFARVYDRGKAFVLRAGTLIMATTIVVWAAGYFPGDHSELNTVQTQLEQLESETADVPEDEIPLETATKIEALEVQHKQLSGQLIEGSVLGRVGHAIEPAVRPLGWDWKIGVGVIASFPAREVIISTMGTIYSLGGDVETDEPDEKLMDRMKQSTYKGTDIKVYNLPVALSIMVFFALCAQCAATLVTIKRETNSWFWPTFTFVYMTALGYIGALVTYQVAMKVFGA